jgi:hypothetical protein
MSDAQPAMATPSGGGPPERDDTESWSRQTKLVAYGIASGLFFAIGLVVTETVGEIGVDIDFKPFVIPYLLIAINRYGVTTLSVGLGAALGEGALDVVEGYELDDPIGFLGYVFGFTVFGWYLHEAADDPTSWSSLTAGAVLGACVQAVFEALAFFVFAATASPLDATISVIGNTLTHGVVLGAIPLVILVRTLPTVADRISDATG